MKLSVTTWSFPCCTLAECAAIARALNIDTLDVGYFYRSALNKERLLREPEAYAGEVIGTAGAPASLYHLFGNGLVDRNLAHPMDAPENIRDFQAVLRFCREAGVSSVSVLRQEEIDVLAPYAAHVPLRQARMGALQSKLEQGTLNFKAILGTLRQAGHGRYLSLECVHQDYMNTLFDDVLSETIKLRDLVGTWLENA